MKTIRRHWNTLLGIFGVGLVVVATALTGWSQTTPVLTITPLGTNLFSITFTNTAAPMICNRRLCWPIQIIHGLGQQLAALARPILLSPAFMKQVSTGRFWTPTAPLGNGRPEQSKLGDIGSVH